MMFVAGETGEPTTETTTLVEQIVHEQVVEMVRRILVALEDSNTIPAQALDLLSNKTWLSIHYRR